MSTESQGELFDPVIPKEDSKKDEHLWNQFARLGEMMGDGEHHERGGGWISREYKRLSKILVPEIKEHYQAQRKAKGERTNTQMAKLLQDKKCKCGGELRQKRSGTKVAYCSLCNTRYVAVSKKK